jgi:hypothetical protein
VGLEAQGGDGRALDTRAWRNLMKPRVGVCPELTCVGPEFGEITWAGSEFFGAYVCNRQGCIGWSVAPATPSVLKYLLLLLVQTSL